MFHAFDIWELSVLVVLVVRCRRPSNFLLRFVAGNAELFGLFSVFRIIISSSLHYITTTTHTLLSQFCQIWLFINILLFHHQLRVESFWWDSQILHLFLT